MKLVMHYRAQAEGCRNFGKRTKNENLRKRYIALAEAYVALAADREKFLQATQTETFSVALGKPSGADNSIDQPSGAR